MLLATEAGIILVGALLFALPRSNALPPTPAVITPAVFAPAATPAPVATLAPTTTPAPLLTEPYPPPATEGQPDGAYPLLPSATAAPSSAAASPPPGASLSSAPLFDLQRENGERVQLASYRGKETVVLVFFRGQT